MAEDQKREEKNTKQNTARNSKAEVNPSKMDCIFHSMLLALPTGCYGRNAPLFSKKKKIFKAYLCFIILNDTIPALLHKSNQLNTHSSSTLH